MLEVQVTDTLTINVDGELAQVPKGLNVIEAVSYTHLTLPTMDSV